MYLSGLAGNVASHLQNICVHSYVLVHRRKYVLDSTVCVKCTQAHVTSSFKLTMSVFTLRKQLRHHQFLVHSLTRNEFFAARVVRVPLRTRVFLKFKLSCTVDHYKYQVIVIALSSS